MSQSIPSIGEYSEVGGLRWGSSFWLSANATWPFVRLTITRDALTIQIRPWPLRRRFTFSPQDVARLGLRRLAFATGLRIEHRLSYPSYLVYWTKSASRLIEHLQQRGWVIDPLEDV